MAGGFEDLNCWKACQELKLYLKENVLSVLPNDEKYELYSQIRRASRSATANIAEGYGRYYDKDQIKYLVQARGSVTEILDHCIEALNWTYIPENELVIIRGKIDDCLKLINGYIRFLRNKK